MDHTGIVFVFGNQRLPVSRRLLERVHVSNADLKQAIAQTASAMKSGASPAYVGTERLGFFGQRRLLKQFETGGDAAEAFVPLQGGQ